MISIALKVLYIAWTRPILPCLSLSLFPSAMSDADLNLNLERGTRKVGDQEEEANRRTGVQTATVGRREKTLNKQSRKGILDKP
jgi:hypothetical protein